MHEPSLDCELVVASVLEKIVVTASSPGDMSESANSSDSDDDSSSDISESKTPRLPEQPVVFETAPNSAISAEYWAIDFSCHPLLVASTFSDFAKDGFLKGVKWSPDGSCFVGATNYDNKLRVYNLPDLYCRSEIVTATCQSELVPTFEIREGDSIYDFTWHSLMDSADPNTCYLFSSSKDHPISMWDAYTGSITASYVAHNHVDVLMAATGIHCCNQSGHFIFAGYQRQIRQFDLNRPGKNAVLVRDTKGHQAGILSCFAQDASTGLLAVGSYDRTVGLYSIDDMMPFCTMTAHRGGVTQVQFASHGNRLFSGGRKDNEIVCWDVRRPGHVLSRFRRKVATNQRIYFDITKDDRFLISAGTDGNIAIFDLTKNTGEDITSPTFQFDAHADCANGVSMHPSLQLLLSSSGQRWFDMEPIRDGSNSASSSDDEAVSHLPVPSSTNLQNTRRENSIKLWQFNTLSSQ